jgi:hypothetical protein
MPAASIGSGPWSLAVGQQDDRGRRIGTRRDGLRRLLAGCRGRILRLGACRVAPRVERAQVELGVGEYRLQRHEDAAADRGAALQMEALDGAQNVLPAVGRRLHHRRRRGERDGADPRRLPAVGDNPRRSCGDDPLGLTSVARSRNVHCEDHRFVRRRQRDDRRRPRDREHQDEREQKEERGHVAAKASRALRIAHQRQARIPQRRLALPAHQQQINGDDHRDRGEQPQELRPRERHWNHPCDAHA